MTSFNKAPTMKQLENIAKDNDGVSFINTNKGRLVVFNPDLYVWNAYGKDSFDSDEFLTDEQWEEFMMDNDEYFYLEPDDGHYRTFTTWCEEHVINEDEE